MLNCICLAAFGLLTLSGYYFVYHKPDANLRAQKAGFYQIVGDRLMTEVQKNSEHALERMKREMDVEESEMTFHGQVLSIKGTLASRIEQTRYLQEQQHKDFVHSNALASRVRRAEAELEAHQELNDIEARESRATLNQMAIHSGIDGHLQRNRLEQTKEDNELVKTMYARQNEIDSANMVDSSTKENESLEIGKQGTNQQIEAKANQGTAMLGQPPAFENKD